MRRPPCQRISSCDPPPLPAFNPPPLRGILFLPQIQSVQAVQAASRQLCHKQMTWFRDEEMFRSAVAGILFHRIVGACGVLWTIGMRGAECVCWAAMPYSRGLCHADTHSDVGTVTPSRIGLILSTSPGIFHAGGSTPPKARRRSWLKCWSAGRRRSTRAAAATAGASRESLRFTRFLSVVGC